MWSPHTHGPHIVSMLSPCGLHIPVVPILSPRCLHIVLMLSPCCPHVVSTSQWSPCCPHVVSTSLWSPCCLHIVLMLSPCCLHVVPMWSPKPHGPHVVSTLISCCPHVVSTSPWSPCCPHGGNKITKNAITFERIEIIEFCLKIWDPWALPHTYTLHLTYRWGVSYPKWQFYPKTAPVTRQKNFSCFCTGSH